MNTVVDMIRQSAGRWVRKHFAFPLLVLLAALLLIVSEETYDQTTSTLRGGIALTDARMSTTRLMQLLADAETAQLGVLATGRPEYLSRFAAAKDEIAAVEVAVRAFFEGQGAEGAATAQRVAAATTKTIAGFERSIRLVRDGDPAGAAQIARDAAGLAETDALRADLSRQLARAAEQQQRTRSSIYDALLINRVAVGVLTLVTLLSLFLLLRQLQVQDRESSQKQAALVDQGQRLEAQVRRRTVELAELARHLQTVREDERAHLARELHDELGGLLTASKLDLARARWKVGDDSAELLSRLDRLNDNLNKGIELKRRIIEDLRPSTLSSLGLSTALEVLCREMSASLSIPVNLSVTSFQLSAAADLTVFRFVQEALTNIGKYAAAQAVEVSLRVVGDDAAVEVRDDGVGFDERASRAGRHGLSGMRFRAESLGGSMSIDSQPGRGTTLRLQFPQSAAV